jgi:hypothetical protein
MYDHRGAFIERDDEWTEWCDGCLGDLHCSDKGNKPKHPAVDDAVCEWCGGDLNWRDREEEEE